MRFRLLALVPFIALAPARAEVTLLGVGSLPGDATDLSGLTGKQTDGTPNNRLGGHGSAIAYTGRGADYILASDRGPKDGGTDFACRVHRMTITVTPGTAPAVSLKLTATTMLTNDAGRAFVGTAAAIDPDPAKSRRLDPEGVRVGRDGHVFISDEYGPFVYEFDAKGRRVKELPVPAKFRPLAVGPKPEDELPPKNTAGRLPNRGMEGLAITPDGAKLVGLMQSPLIQDGALGADAARVGLNCRLLEIDRATGKTREFVYPLDDAGNGASEILAVNDHEFLVIERDSKAGKEAAAKKIFLIDLAWATDVSAVERLPAAGLPKGVKPAAKKLFFDLLDSRFGIAGPDCLEKFEGLAFGPDLPDGRRLLLVTADNDFVADRPFRVYAFAVGRKDLPAYSPQAFD